MEASCAEPFLTLSPRVHFRPPHFVFVDVESTLGLMGGESRALNKALDIAHRFGAPDAQAAIAGNAYWAQVLAEGQVPESSRYSLGVDALLHLEGILPWEKPRAVQEIANFFKSMGQKRLQDLRKISLPAFRERWGSLGTSLWKRLNDKEPQVISPLIPVDPFLEYGFFEHSISAVYLLMNELEKPLQRLFLRLEGLGKFARRVELSLHCEYSKTIHRLDIEPVSPSRDLKLFMDLLHQRLDALDLENPVKEFEITLFEQAEKVQQLDFFEPRDTSEERWQRLVSMAEQAGLKMGFLQPEPSHFPERSFSLLSDWPKTFSAADFIQRVDDSVQVKFVHAKNLSQSPRPSLLLETPEALSLATVKKLKALSSIPAERIESSWWEYFRKSPQEDLRSRDYYFMLSEEGQLLWVFRDRDSKKFFLHGYFD
jgi:protein ImuB